ncbi:hypothetical protein Cgig2_030970 [Carnegiea gigantea]|uniref:Uncharacterized protein n=1 Tax=Carnegiea gigantea TaxID=171969 RepID=A0A9Q1QL78_9CARY|nr:hypothetical protein Cgig2_030970 [Carnegiea gigantea]
MLPKPNSTDSINTKTLELIYLLMTGKPVNFAQCILGAMSKVSSIRHPAPLPYATLLTFVVTHFGVCLTNKIKETKPMPIITLASLKLIQFFKTESGEWKFVDDMTQEELVSVSKMFGQHVKPRLTSPQITCPPSLLDHILTLDENVHELQETVDKLEYIMVQHTNVLDGIAHNQAIIYNQSLMYGRWDPDYVQCEEEHYYIGKGLFPRLRLDQATAIIMESGLEEFWNRLKLTKAKEEVVVFEEEVPPEKAEEIELV